MNRIYEQQVWQWFVHIVAHSADLYFGMQGEHDALSETHQQVLTQLALLSDSEKRAVVDLVDIFGDDPHITDLGIYVVAKRGRSAAPEITARMRKTVFDFFNKKKPLVEKHDPWRSERLCAAVCRLGNI